MVLTHSKDQKYEKDVHLQAVAFEGWRIIRYEHSCMPHIHDFALQVSRLARARTNGTCNTLHLSCLSTSGVAMNVV